MPVLNTLGATCLMSCRGQFIRNRACAAGAAVHVNSQAAAVVPSDGDAGLPRGGALGAGCRS